MFFTNPIFIGIDPAAPQRSFSYAALDRNLNLVALADGDMDAVTAFLAGQQSATVAINAPSGVNRGLVKAMLKKEMLAPSKMRPTEYRLAEYELREHGITVKGTPANAADCPSWVQTGFSLYRKLLKMGFQKYPVEGASHQLLETNPLACFSVLAECVPLSKSTLEGKIQRQLILYERGLQIKDPMDFFEEITRHKMMHGIWAHDLLYSPEQLDAMIAAYTAWFAVNKPAEITFVGDEKEGRIVLPERNLKGKY